jgi:hypothetical protein
LRVGKQLKRSVRVFGSEREGRGDCRLTCSVLVGRAAANGRCRLCACTEGYTPGPSSCTSSNRGRPDCRVDGGFGRPRRLGVVSRPSGPKLRSDKGPRQDAGGFGCLRRLSSRGVGFGLLPETKGYEVSNPLALQRCTRIKKQS